MGQAEKLVETAMDEVGTKEYPPGSNNVHYNTWFYGKSVSGADYPWCCVFVMWCFERAGLTGMLPKTASCATLLQNAKDTRRFVKPEELRAGDVVLYKFSTNNRAANHVGIVVSADAQSVTAIEGNTSLTSEDNGGAVMCRVRNLKNVVGGLRPKYEEDEEMKRYNKVEEIRGDKTLANAAFLADAAERFIKAGVIKGNPLDITSDMLRSLIYTERLLENAAAK